MHTREAREDGETNERLDRLVVWRHVDDYSPREKAALAFTEAMTRLDDQSVLPELRAALREHFSEQEVAALGADIAMNNPLNRFAISSHSDERTRRPAGIQEGPHGHHTPPLPTPPPPRPPP